MRKWIPYLGIACLVGFSSSYAVAPPEIPPDLHEMEKTLKTVVKRLDHVEKELTLIKQVEKLQDLPISQSMFSADEIVSWSLQSVLEMNHYDYLNYQYILKKIKPFFTKAGYESYLKALENSKNLDSVRFKKLVVTARLTGEPSISK